MKEAINVVLIGRSGSGKGTQAKLLMEKIDNFYYLSTGDLFRDLAQQDTAAGRRIRKILDEGGLPYDDLATTLWMHNLAYNLKENQHLMADGFPRRLQEAKDFDNFLDLLDRADNTFYILFDISRDEAFKRMINRGRPDDSAESINNRLDYYEDVVQDVVDYYKQKGVLKRVDGERSVEEIHQDILRVAQG